MKHYKLGIGAMSPEIIEAVFRCSDIFSIPLMLIASKNQIDWDYGYVNNWNTYEYVKYLSFLRKKYPNADVLICRDHCGPGFKNHNLKDFYKTIETDIKCGFDLIHIDFSLYDKEYEKILIESKKAIEFALNKNNRIILEIGTEKIASEGFKDILHVKKDIHFFNSFASITFYVPKTGSLVRGMSQVGNFSYEYVKSVKEELDNYNIFLKEHNADYLSAEQIELRRGIVDAFNIAPCLGVLQTLVTIEKCIIYGVNYDEFLEDSYNSGKWKKWMKSNSKSDKFLSSLISGHYVFAKKSYKKVYNELLKFEDFHESIVNEVVKYIHNFYKNISQ